MSMCQAIVYPVVTTSAFPPLSPDLNDHNLCRGDAVVTTGLAHYDAAVVRISTVGSSVMSNGFSI